ncbi:MAG: metalloregulator ArsR/SmtB family transcription factor [Gammaproteobacteria bacterium]
MPSRALVARELAEMFKLLAHPDRIRLIEELGAGEKDVNTLAEASALASTRVSQHLSLLRAHRIVEERREGRHRYYHLQQPDMAAWIVAGLDFIEGRRHDIDKSKIRAVRRLWAAQANAERESHD